MGFLNALAALCITAALTASGAWADNIVIAGDLWCPVNCEPTANPPGIVVEIATEVLSAEGHTVEYRVLPWERAIQLGREGKINGIIAAYKAEAPDYIYPGNEQLMVNDSFFVTRSSTWRYTGPASLENIKLGIIAGYLYSEEINGYIAKHSDDGMVQVGHGDEALKKQLQKLQIGRIGVLLETDMVFWHLATKMGIADNFKEIDDNTAPQKAYLAFSPADKNSAAYAKTLSMGMDKLRNSGRLAQILAKYGLKDWR